MIGMPDHNLAVSMNTAIAEGRELLGDRAYPVALLIAGQPLDLAGPVMKGMARGVEKAGFEAVLIERTGMGVVWAVDRRQGRRS